MKNILTLLLIFFSLNTFSQSCGCDVTITNNDGNGIYYPNLLSSLLPGQTLCITAGTYDYMSLGYIRGTAANPITIKNCGGKVIFTGANGYCARIVKSQYFHFTGTGSSDTYGFWMRGTPGGSYPGGLTVEDSVTDFEVDHVEASHNENGFICNRTPDSCASYTYYPNWFIRNAKWHDNYGHKSNGEMYYIGNTAANYVVKKCGGGDTTIESVHLRGVSIYNNIIDTAGWDGIQLASADSAANIYNNTIDSFGTRNTSGQQAGILFGGKCSGSVYNNQVTRGTGNGIEIFGFNTVPVYNNVLYQVGKDGTVGGQDALLIADRPQGVNATGYDSLKVNAINNTIVDCGAACIQLDNSYLTLGHRSKFINNFLVKPTSTYITRGATAANNYDSSSNYYLAATASALFVNPSIYNFALQATSPAVGAGVNTGTTYNVTTDFLGITRTIPYSIGAYQYNTPPPPAVCKIKINSGLYLVFNSR